MGGKILLIFHSSGDKAISIEKLPPIGILSIAAYLENKGIETDVLDFTIRKYKEIHCELYDVIGFSINISNLQVSLNEIEKIKKGFPDKLIVVGGPLCMSNPTLFTGNGNIDVVFECEGEEALHEYLEFDDPSYVKGIYFRKGNELIYTGRREWIKDLDKLPFPSFDKVDIKKYNNFPKRRHPVSSIITSRGCPYNCIFCSHSMGRKWRKRSADNVVEEISWQVSKLGVKEILIYDDNFSLEKERAERICDLLIEKGIKIKIQFSNGLRVDNLDVSLLAKLKKAGTWFIGLAPETGNPEIMKKIKKGFDHEKVNDIRKACKTLGIKTHGFFMIGFPFESMETIEDTIQYAKDLGCDIVEFNKVVPYAKTELYDILVNEGKLLNDSANVARSYHEGTILTHKVGDLEEHEIKKIIRRAYREYYLRPIQIYRLLTTFSIRDLLVLSLYAIRTGNV